MSTRLDAYHPPRRVQPTTIRREDVGASTWFALVRDGVARPLWGDVAVPADLDDTAEMRATALAALVPHRGVVGRRSAAWVHTGHRPPVKVDVLVAARAHRADPHPQRSAAEATFAPADVVRIGPVRVTSVQRTGLDVARWVPPGDALDVLARLRDAGFDPDRARRTLDDLAGRRGVDAARRTLRTLTG